jgi:hypothetical protein
MKSRKAHNFINKAGKRYGRLVVIKEADRNKQGGVLWKCRCDCGNVKTIAGNDLQSGKTKSCGCLRKELIKKRNKTHGHNGERIYRIWRNMKNRCLNKKTPDYKYYGARGITVCKEWLKFLPFYEWAMEHGYSDILTIDRRNAYGNYRPSNCSWVTRQEQSHNQRTHKNNKIGIDGVTWYKKGGKYRACIGIDNQRIHLGYFTNIQDAITARKAAELKYWT